MYGCRGRPQLLPHESQASLGRARDAHVEEPPIQAPHALLDPRAPRRQRPRDGLRPAALTPPEPLRPFLRCFTEWKHLAQDRAGWHKLAITPPFAIGKLFLRQPRGDTRVTPKDRRRAVAQRAAGIAERRAVFDANNNN